MAAVAMAPISVGFDASEHAKYIANLRFCYVMKKRESYLTAWEAYNLRKMAFDLRRLEFGLAFGQEMNSQNGNMSGIQHHLSTKADIDLWLFRLGRKMGLLTIKHNEQGLALWAYYSQRENMNAYQPLPEGA